jgi:hypothetical protein
MPSPVQGPSLSHACCQLTAWADACHRVGPESASLLEPDATRRRHQFNQKKTPTIHADDGDNDRILGYLYETMQARKNLTRETRDTPDVVDGRST